MRMWEVILASDETPHVVPVNDLRPHDTDGCWCKPVVDDDIVVHNALDRREDFEQAPPQ